MSAPQWPGPPPGGPGHPPQHPAGPGFPPPRRSGGGALVPLLAFGLTGVLALVGIGAFFVLDDDDDDARRTSTLPTSAPYTTHTPPPPPTFSPEPRPTRTTGAAGSDTASVLSPTIRTAKGNTFTRVGTRTEPCTSRANARLLTELRNHPCVGTMHSAVYADPSRRIITAVSIARFSSPSAASAISRVTGDKGWPKLLTPSRASGLPQPRPDPAYWTRSWTQGSTVVYAQSYWATGGPTGGRSGSVFTTAGELGVEVTLALMWTD